jgi:hypothetical protein
LDSRLAIRHAAIISLAAFAVITQCLLFQTTELFAEADSRVAVFDLTGRKGENPSTKLASVHALHVAGIPFIVSESVEVCSNHVLVLISSTVSATTLTDEEKDGLFSYVADGGVLVAQRITDPDLYQLFGVEQSLKGNRRFEMNWLNAPFEPELRWLDDPMESWVRLGKNTYQAIFNTTAYLLNGAQPLALFDDGSAAVTRYSFGRGLSYLLGISLKDAIVRAQLNLDFEAQRPSSNGFEPAADTFMLFLRGIYQTHVRYPVWKHTLPADNRSLLILTHDCDSTSGMALLPSFARLGWEKGIKTTYFVATRYFSDGVLSDFYTKGITSVRAAVDQGQALGSHSVGHFRDFDSEEAFPLGQIGNTRWNYSPLCVLDPVTKEIHTEGGSVIGELEVSRQVLDEDHGVWVSVFRSGHLLWNEKLVNGLQMLGYKYDSSLKAREVLTAFPYRLLKDNSFKGALSDVFEVPVGASDLLYVEDEGGSQSSVWDPPNWSPAQEAEIVQGWLELLHQNGKNHAPTVLLIHPNRQTKLKAEAALLNHLPRGTAASDLESFGDFWRRRERVSFRVSSERSTLTIHLDSDEPLRDPELALVIGNGQQIGSVQIRTNDDESVSYLATPWGQKDLLIFGLTRQRKIPGDTDDSKSLDIVDFTAATAMLSGKIPADASADTNADFKVDVFDCTAILAGLMR